jgi:hypothetical protein
MQRLLASKKTVEAGSVCASLFPISHYQTIAGQLVKRARNSLEIITNFLKNSVMNGEFGFGAYSRDGKVGGSGLGLTDGSRSF